MPEGNATVFVVDDDLAVREALDSLLRSAGFDVLLFATAQDFLAAREPEASGCLVLDVNLPGVNGLELQQQLLRAAIPLPIVFITGHGAVPTTVRAMKAGAVEFLTKPFDPDALIAAVREALALDSTARARREEVAALRRRYALLTAREREVLELVVEGRLNKQIAASLGTAEQTVKVHRAHITKKLGVTSVADLVRFAEGIRQAGGPSPLGGGPT